MHCTVAKISFISSRNCFVALPKSVTSKFSSDKINGIKIESLNSSLYTSWAGDVSGSHHLEDIVEISGLFASKLGFQNKQEVTVTILPVINDCISAQVEPASVDDWEILEMNANSIESNLLNQVRIVSIGQIFPIWVQRSTCVYVTIGRLEPSSSVCVLQPNTELIVAPKSRHSSIQRNNFSPLPCNGTHSEVGDSSKIGGMLPNGLNVDKSSDSISADISEESSSKGDRKEYGIFSYLTSFWKDLNKAKDKSSMLPLMIDKCLPKDFSASFRVLALEDFVSSGDDDVRFLSSFEREAFLDPSLQPCNIFISRDSMLAAGDVSSDELPSCFLARISKLSSPEEKKDSLKQKVRHKASDRSFSKLQEKVELSDQSEEADEKSIPDFIIVRVMVVLSDNCCRINDSVNFRCNDVIPFGHTLIHADLRRMMNIEKMSRIQIAALKTLQDSIPPEISLHSLLPLPEGFTDSMVQIAARQWIESVSRPSFPLVLHNGMFFQCFVKEGFFGEFFLTFGLSTEMKKSSEKRYFLLSSNHVERIKLASSSLQRSGFQSPPPLKEFDSNLPTVTFDQLHIDAAVKNAVMEYVDICLHRYSATKQPFPHCSLTGLANGGLLLCGAKGSGKTSLGMAICDAASWIPHYAFVEVVDCKVLKGKRPENIRQYFEQKFDELSWRQPALLFLDDLDNLVASSSGPEHDNSGLASYYTRVAEILRDLIQRESYNGSSIALVASAVNSNSVHSLLVAARGSHAFTRIIEIKPPKQSDRIEILSCLLKNRRDIAGDCIDRLDLLKISAQTEGYTVKDLDQIVNRAIHATLLSSSSSSSSSGSISCQVDLHDEDFEAALVDFKPAALQNVALVQSDELSWADVGGLSNVRSVLIQTLQWPSKYSKLFSCCPLRLQSGILLYGAPGTGKTHLAAVIAKEFNLNFIAVKGPELFNKYIGASEQAVRDTFARAQSAKPCILFFDEFDSLAPKRGHDNTGVTDRVVNQLLTQLDGVENLDGVFVLAATSRPDLIDPALLRPGRLDKSLHCPIPSKAERLEILKALSRKMQFSEDIDLQAVADRCTDFTGADFKALLYNAQLEAIHERTSTLKSPITTHEPDFVPKEEEISLKSDKAVSSSPGGVGLIIVSQRNLLQACGDIQPSVSPSERRKYNHIYESFVGSRGANFVADSSETVGQRVTLA